MNFFCYIEREHSKSWNKLAEEKNSKVKGYSQHKHQNTTDNPTIIIYYKQQNN